MDHTSSPFDKGPTILSCNFHDPWIIFFNHIHTKANSKMPDECSACTKPFDKKDREMVMSWSVVVRNDDETVRLYCPTCWDTAQKVVADFHGAKDEDV